MLEEFGQGSRILCVCDSVGCDEFFRESCECVCVCVVTFGAPMSHRTWRSRADSLASCAPRIKALFGISRAHIYMRAHPTLASKITGFPPCAMANWPFATSSCMRKSHAHQSQLLAQGFGNYQSSFFFFVFFFHQHQQQHSYKRLSRPTARSYCHSHTPQATHLLLLITRSFKRLPLLHLRFYILTYYLM